MRKHSFAKLEATLKDRNFLLFMAAVTGTVAFRNLMIPLLISHLKLLGPSDCISEAFLKTRDEIEERLLMMKDRRRIKSVSCQISIEMNTLGKKFCIGKDFSLASKLSHHDAFGRDALDDNLAHEPYSDGEEDFDNGD